MQKRIFAIVILHFAFLIFYSSPAFSQQRKVKVTGHITFIPLYRGGIGPTEEVMKACCTPRPLARKTMYAKKSYYARNFRAIHTDASGNFSLRLAPGPYNLYFENKTRKPSPVPECEEWLTRPQAEITVLPSANKKFDLVIREMFNPCEPMPQ